MADLDVVAEDVLVAVLMVVVSVLLDTGIVRVRSLAEEYRAANHSNHRRRSPWTELASQSTKNGFIFKLLKQTDSRSCARLEYCCC